MSNSIAAFYDLYRVSLLSTSLKGKKARTINSLLFPFVASLDLCRAIDIATSALDNSCDIGGGQ